MDQADQHTAQRTGGQSQGATAFHLIVDRSRTCEGLNAEGELAGILQRLAENTANAGACWLRAGPHSASQPRASAVIREAEVRLAMEAAQARDADLILFQLNTSCTQARCEHACDTPIPTPMQAYKPDLNLQCWHCVLRWRSVCHACIHALVMITRLAGSCSHSRDYRCLWTRPAVACLLFSWRRRRSEWASTSHHGAGQEQQLHKHIIP
jgi:hypothetical protein